MAPRSSSFRRLTAGPAGSRDREADPFVNHRHSAGRLGNAPGFPVLLFGIHDVPTGERCHIISRASNYAHEVKIRRAGADHT